MTNCKLTISYDGARYDGFARKGKDESNNTIEVKILDVLRRMPDLNGEELELSVACRTEKGVNAIAQVINFKTEARLKAIEVKNYLNRYLPRDISCIDAELSDERFNSQLNLKRICYEYRIDATKVADVFLRRYYYHTFVRPDIELMRECGKLFLGEHDFTEFTTAKKAKSYIKRIDSVEIEEIDDKIYIRVTANAFLHNMARLIIGAILDVGLGDRSLESVRISLSGKKCDAKNPILPVESFALFLKSVEY